MFKIASCHLSLFTLSSPALQAAGLNRLYFVSNKLDEYSVGTMDFSGKKGSNMHIMRVDVV